VGAKKYKKIHNHEMTVLDNSIDRTGYYDDRKEI